MKFPDIKTFEVRAKSNSAMVGESIFIVLKTVENLIMRCEQKTYLH